MQKTHQFFLSYIPGTIEAGKLEFEEKCKQLEFSYELSELVDGLQVSMTLEQGCLLNYYLKVPTKILLRIAEFKCRDLPKLFNKLKKIDWNNYVCTELMTFKISSYKSRLFDSSRIEKSARNALEFYLKANEPKKKYKEAAQNIIQEIYLRFDNDLCTVSINTTGDRLDRRGQRVLVGKAPLRETLAATMVYETISFLTKLKKDHSDYTLVDPMCGSGVIPLEAITLNELAKRQFNFEVFPYFINHGVKNLVKLPASGFEKIILKDIDSKILEAAKSNLHFLNVQFYQEDALKIKESIEHERCVIISNPPYNIRLKTHKNFYNELILALRENYHPECICLLIPKEQFHSFKFKKDVKVKKELTNGGLPILLLIL